MYSQLVKLKIITEEVSQLLGNGDMENTLEKLKQRDKIIANLKENSKKLNVLNEVNASHNKMNREYFGSITSSIIKLDQENAEMLKTRMDNTYKSLCDLIKEKQNVKNFKAISTLDNKQIVDILNY